MQVIWLDQDREEEMSIPRYLSRGVYPNIPEKKFFVGFLPVITFSPFTLCK